MSVLVLVSGATVTMRRLNDPRFGRFIEPRGGHRPSSLDLRPNAWAMDNGSYGGFKEPAFVRMLEKYRGWPGCLFVAAPDVLGDAVRTLALWPIWYRALVDLGYPAAFVAQDGLTIDTTPWHELSTLFIGGSTEWKEGPEAAALMAAAVARRLPVHVGRVSTWGRFRYMARKGANSVDTSGVSRWPDDKTRKFQRWMTRLERQPELPL